MALATITHEDGTTTVDQMFTSIDFTLTDDLSHEFVVWSDGSFTIDGLVGEGPATDHIHLDISGLRQLRAFLNSARVTTLLDAATS